MPPQHSGADRYLTGRGILEVEYTQINPGTAYVTVGFMMPF